MEIHKHVQKIVLNYVGGFGELKIMERDIRLKIFAFCMFHDSQEFLLFVFLMEISLCSTRLCQYSKISQVYHKADISFCLYWHSRRTKNRFTTNISNTNNNQIKVKLIINQQIKWKMHNTDSERNDAINTNYHDTASLNSQLNQRFHGSYH